MLMIMIFKLYDCSSSVLTSVGRSADVENPAEAADETPLPETQDEQKEAADKADGNAKRRKKAYRMKFALAVVQSGPKS